MSKNCKHGTIALSLWKVFGVIGALYCVCWIAGAVHAGIYDEGYNKGYDTGAHTACKRLVKFVNETSAEHYNEILCLTWTW